MKMDRNALAALVGQTDENLWKTIVAVAKQSGITLSENQPSAGDMAKLRDLLSSAGNMSTDAARKIIVNFEENQKKNNDR